MAEPCDACGDPVSNALARVVSLMVDRAEIDSQRLCPECFADWIDRYEREMHPDPQGLDGDSEIIVD